MIKSQKTAKINPKANLLQGAMQIKLAEIWLFLKFHCIFAQSEKLTIFSYVFDFDLISADR